MDKDWQVLVVPREGDQYPKVYLEDEAESILSDALIVLHQISSHVIEDNVLPDDHPFRKDLRECIMNLHYGILDFYAGPVGEG